jgi:hypothetical protein
MSNQQEVYVVLYTPEHEPSDLISVHTTEAAAMAKAESYAKEVLKVPYLVEDGYITTLYTNNLASYKSGRIEVIKQTVEE